MGPLSEPLVHCRRFFQVSTDQVRAKFGILTIILKVGIKTVSGGSAFKPLGAFVRMGVIMCLATWL